MRKNNFPTVAVDEVPPAEVKQIVGSLKQLHDMGQCKTDAEVEQRMDDFFAFCEATSVRPGIESLCMALHISRQTLFNWAAGIKCSPERQRLAESAKSFVSAYIEQALLSGKISPPSGIFLMKNWCSYKDSISIEESIPRDKAGAETQSRAEIAERYGYPSIEEVATDDASKCD